MNHPLAAQVGALDVLLASHVLWRKPESRQPLADWLLDRCLPDDAAPLALLADALADRSGRGDAVSGEARDLAAAVEIAIADLDAAAAAAQADRQLFLAPDALLAVKQHLAPLAADRRDDLAFLLETATALADGAPLPERRAPRDADRAAAPKTPARPATDADADLDLTWSKKQAKARLTAGEFKRWTALRADERARS